jgi:glycosyltransferase involved in cell wall biosynthesis
LFRALTGLWSEGLRFRLVLIGAGPEEAALRSAAEAGGYGGAVSFVGAEWREEQLAPWFLSARALVHPGPIGLGLLHSFAYGLPVVTHDNPRHHGPEIHALSPGVNGLCFAEGDAGDLARALRVVLGDEARLAELSLAARRTTRLEYSFENMVSRFHAALLLSRRVARERHGAGRA